jgi:Rieske Fe-S protein
MRENQLTHCSRRGFVCHLAGAVTTVSVLRGVKGYDILVIRTGKKTLSALDPTCTHKQCEVSYEKKWGEIRCDCHGSVYSTGGVVEEGPAEQDLTKYPVYLEKKRIVIELPAETGGEPTS